MNLPHLAYLEITSNLPGRPNPDHIQPTRQTQPRSHPTYPAPKPDHIQPTRHPTQVTPNLPGGPPSSLPGLPDRPIQPSRSYPPAEITSQPTRQITSTCPDHIQPTRQITSTCPDHIQPTRQILSAQRSSTFRLAIKPKPSEPRNERA